MTTKQKRKGGDARGRVPRTPGTQQLTRANRQRLERAVEIYLQECAERKTAARVSELADFVGVGAQHLNVVFRRVFGMTPGEMLRARRLEQAAQMLRATKLTVSDIAAMTGFGTDRTFFRTFTRAHHVTPDEYRREARK
ncbi:MAG TPA: helix-turn-helix transcriptional regulator [Thermoanaerobaculia bacterium]|nr:helix-turn-helix transcriptional regulator [Thermoanaerobaculia bacterium]